VSSNKSFLKQEHSQVASASKAVVDSSSIYKMLSNNDWIRLDRISAQNGRFKAALGKSNKSTLVWRTVDTTYDASGYVTRPILNVIQWEDKDVIYRFRYLNGFQKVSLYAIDSLEGGLLNRYLVRKSRDLTYSSYEVEHQHPLKERPIFEALHVYRISTKGDSLRYEIALAVGGTKDTTLAVVGERRIIFEHPILNYCPIGIFFYPPYLDHGLEQDTIAH